MQDVDLLQLDVQISLEPALAVETVLVFDFGAVASGIKKIRLSRSSSI
jgi:hypothetical protein